MITGYTQPGPVMIATSLAASFTRKSRLHVHPVNDSAPQRHGLADFIQRQALVGPRWILQNTIDIMDATHKQIQWETV